MSAAQKVDAEIKRARTSLRKLDDEMLDCRNIGHAWRVLRYFRGHEGETRRTLVCDRCDSERVDRWNSRTAERVGAMYRYGEGYSIKGGGVQASDVRAECMRRAQVFASEDQMLAALTEGGRR